MIGVRAAAIASLGFVLVGQPAAAQTLGYREYTLGASVASVAATSGVRAADIKTLHSRPAKIQELDWRIPYGRSGNQSVDPVRDIRFSFYNDQLYQLVVTYDRDRTEGLTDQDIVDSLSGTYGPALLGQRALVPVAADVAAETVVIAQWEGAGGLLTLMRDSYRPLYQLVLVSTALDAQARAAIKEALVLDVREAPQREVDRRRKVASDAAQAGEKARALNKAAFRP